MGAIHSIVVAVSFHLLDMVTGLIGAVKHGELKSSKMRDGMFKKVGFIACYVLAYLIDTYGVIIGVSFSVQVLPIIITYAVTTEIVSVFENINKINSDILPETLKKLFHFDEIGKEN